MSKFDDTMTGLKLTYDLCSALVKLIWGLICDRDDLACNESKYTLIKFWFIIVLLFVILNLLLNCLNCLCDRLEWEESDNKQIVAFEIEDYCVVCYENKPEIINLPCGHYFGCEKCYESFKKFGSICMMCKKKIKKTVLVKNGK